MKNYKPKLNFDNIPADNSNIRDDKWILLPIIIIWTVEFLYTMWKLTIMYVCVEYKKIIKFYQKNH